MNVSTLQSWSLLGGYDALGSVCLPVFFGALRAKGLAVKGVGKCMGMLILAPGTRRGPERVRSGSLPLGRRRASVRLWRHLTVLRLCNAGVW